MGKIMGFSGHLLKKGHWKYTFILHLRCLQSSYICFMHRCVALCAFFLTFQFNFAQSFKVFKGDTINRVDNKGLKQGVWRYYYPTDTLFTESTFKNGKRTGIFKTCYKKGTVKSLLKYR